MSTIGMWKKQNIILKAKYRQELQLSALYDNLNNESYMYETELLDPWLSFPKKATF